MTRWKLWIGLPLLMLLGCGAMWCWAVSVPQLAHASGPNDPLWLQEHMRRQRLANKILPYAPFGTYGAAALTLGGAVMARRLRKSS